MLGSTSSAHTSDKTKRRRQRPTSEFFPHQKNVLLNYLPSARRRAGQPGLLPQKPSAKINTHTAACRKQPTAARPRCSLHTHPAINPTHLLKPGTLPPQDRGGPGEPGAEAHTGVSRLRHGLPGGVRAVHDGVLRLRPRAAHGAISRLYLSRFSLTARKGWWQH